MTELSLFGWGCMAWAAIIIFPCWVVSVVHGWIERLKKRRRRAPLL